MPEASDIPIKTWSLDDLHEMTPGEFLIGHVTKQWEGDSDSLYEAVVSMLAAGLVDFGGLDPETATDMAMAQAERITSISWDGKSLVFDMGEGQD